MNGKELLELAEVKRVPLRPGDVLAVYLSREPTDYEADYISERLKTILGMDVKVVIMPPGFDLKVMGPEEEPTT
jgi:hypothetical protein